MKPRTIAQINAAIESIFKNNGIDLPDRSDKTFWENFQNVLATNEKDAKRLLDLSIEFDEAMKELKKITNKLDS